MSNRSFYYETLFDEGREEHIKNFKYKGVDNSIVYQYVFSPVSQFLVDRVIPPWVASPN